MLLKDLPPLPFEPLQLPKVWENDYSDIKGEQVTGEDSDTMDAVAELVHWNIKEVIISVSAIERSINLSLVKYFSPLERNLFQGTFLHSDFFTFASMIKTMRQIQAKEKFYDAKEWSEIEKALRSSMRYRNMLVHGRLFGHKNQGKLGVRVEYFEGEPRKMELDQDRWLKIANDIRTAHDYMMQLMGKIWDLRTPEDAHVVKDGDVTFTFTPTKSKP